MLQFCCASFLKSLSNYKGTGIRKIVPKYTTNSIKKPKEVVTTMQITQEHNHQKQQQQNGYKYRDTSLSGPFPLNLGQQSMEHNASFEICSNTLTNYFEQIKINIEPKRLQQARNIKE